MSIKFNDSPRNMVNFFDYMSVMANDNSLIANLKIMENEYLYLNSPQKSKKTNFLLNNLRMAIFDTVYDN